MTTGLFRLRVRYGKHDRLRYLGHLELLRTIDRSVRRSGLPFAITQGYSPHMRIQFSSALPVGAVSDSEWYDLFLTELVAPDVAFGALADATPADIAPVEAAFVDPSMPALEAWLDRFAWRLAIEPVVREDELSGALQRVIERGSIDYMRGPKQRTVSISDKLVSHELSAHDDGSLVLDVNTRVGEGGSLRPGVLLDAALKEAGRVEGPLCYAVEKLGQWHEEDDGTLLEPLS